MLASSDDTLTFVSGADVTGRRPAPGRGGRRLGAAIAGCLMAAGAGLSCASPAPSSGHPVLTQIVGAAGGQVSTANGRLKMQIPAGALTRDVVITIRSDAPAAGSLGPVYEIGPTGTLFQRAVTLSLSFAGLDFGGADAESLHVATLSGGRWVPVTSTVDRVSLSATGQITHLSPWTLIVYTDVVPPEPEAGAGGDMDGGTTRDAAADATNDAPEGGAGERAGGGGSPGTGGAAGAAGSGGSGQAGAGGSGQGGAGAGGQAGAGGAAGGGAGDSGQGGGGGQGGGAGTQNDASSDADTTDGDPSDGGVDFDADAT